ncbi:MAG: tetrahydromethanopterin S-methyltransferase subunit A, partial [Deltaproteobacteria bacterium]|nr:tetrahydromethanopterin S-methyltransferase subunit A [Deltaproteobacteria bacterium]
MSNSDVISAARDRLRLAIDAPKCRVCGCLAESIDGLAAMDSVRAHLADLLDEAVLAMEPRQYDCLGCAECWPVQALALFGPDGPPSPIKPAHAGEPPLPGDYRLLNTGAPVAVCTLGSPGLPGEIERTASPHIALAGTMYTENLGIERVIANTLAQPHLRFLIVCGEDAKRAVGHFPGRSLLALAQNGVNGDGAIVGAPGKRAVLRNVTREQVELFRRQVEIVDRVGLFDVDAIASLAGDLAARNPGPFDGAAGYSRPAAIVANRPGKLVKDPAGFLVIYPDRARGRIVLEHYDAEGLLGDVLEGTDAQWIYLESLA